VIIFAFANKIV